MPADDVLRIANCSGFYGDRLAAAREMVEGGPIDVLTGDYLAELTLMILFRDRLKSPGAGYARTSRRRWGEWLGTSVARGIKIVANAGGLNPAGLAAEVEQLATRLGVRARIAHVEGDDLLPRLADLQARGVDLRHLDQGTPLAALDRQVVTANAYLGAWGIVEALRRGADVVICPRVTDAALTLGPAAWQFGWARDDWDRLATGIVAGHILECGPQCTGGNYSFFRDVPDIARIGFPIAEMHADGSFDVTKHPGTGGLVSVGTVTAQLLYEIQGPRYLNADATARFDSIRLEQAGPDRPRVQQQGGRDGARELPRLLHHLPAGRRVTVRRVLARARPLGAGRAPRGDRRRDDRRAPGPPAGRPPRGDGGGGRRSAPARRTDRAPATRHDLRRPLGGQGRERERGGVGPERGRLCLARRDAHRRHVPAPRPRGRCPPRRAPRAAEPVEPQLRRARAPRRRGRRVDAQRPAGQEPGRVPARPAGGRPAEPARGVAYTPTTDSQLTHRPAAPPRLWVSPSFGSGICRRPASPRSWSHISYIMRSPLAPIGWPKLLSPPSGFTGCGPSPSKRPSSTSFHALPRGEKPMSSMRTSSVGVKQSCTSAMLISARGSFTPACR